MSSSALPGTDRIWKLLHFGLGGVAERRSNRGLPFDPSKPRPVLDHQSSVLPCSGIARSVVHLHCTVQVWGGFLHIAKPMSMLVTESMLTCPRAALNGTGEPAKFRIWIRSPAAHLGHGTTATPSSTDTNDKHFSQCALVTHAGIAAILSWGRL